MKLNFGLMLTLTCCGLADHSAAAAAQPTTNSPQYCMDFDAQACAKIAVVVESGKRPSYCVSDFATNANLHLTREQYRICYAMNAVYGRPEEVQRMQDASAMVKEKWMSYKGVLETLEIGYKCDVIDELSFSVAVQAIQSEMLDVQIRAGVVNDPALNIQNYTRGAIESGQKALNKGACARMTRATRGRIRALVDDLMR